MKTHKTIGAVLAVLVLIMSASAACTSGSRAPQRPFEITAMLMDATLFLPGWRNRSITNCVDR